MTEPPRDPARRLLPQTGHGARAMTVTRTHATPSDPTAHHRHAEERRQLAAALRWAARLGMQEATDNHFSLAVPTEDPTRPLFLINPWGLHWSEITASSLLLTDRGGTVLEGTGRVEATALHIHAPLHLADPRNAAVLHTHMPYATALCTGRGGRLVMGQQNALMFHGQIAYDDHYNGLALDDQEGARMAARLGQARTLMLAGHGVVATGGTVATALARLYYLERACHVQILAESTGRDVQPFPEPVLDVTAAQLRGEFVEQASTYFGYVCRTLDRDEPEYRT